MNRAEKTKVVEQLNHEFSSAPHIMLTTFRGLTVNQASELRRKIRSIGGSYRVIPNRLAKRAAAGTGAEALSESFSGPCAIATHADDPAALAKAIAGFAKENPQIELLAGLVDSREVRGPGRCEAAGDVALPAGAEGAAAGADTDAGDDAGAPGRDSRDAGRPRTRCATTTAGGRLLTVSSSRRAWEFGDGLTTGSRPGDRQKRESYDLLRTTTEEPGHGRSRGNC